VIYYVNALMVAPNVFNYFVFFPQVAPPSPFRNGPIVKLVSSQELNVDLTFGVIVCKI
jgi:hypothetical protein